MVQRHKHHAARVQVFVVRTAFVHAEKAAYHKPVHHIHHRLGHRAIQRFVSVNPFLDNHFAHFQAFFDFRHFIAVFAVQAADFISRFHTHHAHAVSARVGLHNHKRLVFNAFFVIFGLDFRQHALHCRRQCVLAFAFLKIQTANLLEIRVDLPFVNAQKLREFGGHLVVCGKMVRFAARCPASVQRGQYGLGNVAQNVGNAARQIVVQQHKAGRKTVCQMHTVAGALQWLNQQCVAQCGGKFGGFRQFGIERADAHFKACVAQNLRQRIDILQIKRVARVVFRNQQHGFGELAGAFHCVLRGNGGQRDEVRVQVVEAARKEVHVDAGHFVACVADIDRAVKRRRVFFPLAAEPGFDFAVLLQDNGFEFVEVMCIFRRNFGQLHEWTPF